MTSKTLTPFPELHAQERQAARATTMLEHVVDTLTAAVPDEPKMDRARRLRGAAVLAVAAIGELWTTVGWLEAANAADVNGLTEGK